MSGVLSKLFHLGESGVGRVERSSQGVTTGGGLSERNCVGLGNLAKAPVAARPPLRGERLDTAANHGLPSVLSGGDRDRLPVPSKPRSGRRNGYPRCSVRQGFWVLPFTAEDLCAALGCHRCHFRQTEACCSVLRLAADVLDKPLLVWPDATDGHLSWNKL